MTVGPSGQDGAVHAPAALVEERPRLEAVVFDMDGVLLDSEPFWQQAEIEVFGSLGRLLTVADCRETMGMRIDEVVERRFAEQPWRGMSQEAVADAVVSRVIELVEERGEPLPGVREVLGLLEAAGVRRALASSSSSRLIEAVLATLGLARDFELYHSAEEEVAGKPDPAVYRSCLGRLGLAPPACVAVEDSPAGVAAAKAAGMRCIAVPDARLDRRLVGAADLVLSSLLALDADTWSHFAASRLVA